MALKREVKGDIITYSRKLVTRDKSALLKELKRLAKLKDKEAAHDTADNLLIEYLGDDEIAKAYNDIEWWYA
jgi:hypothetical protein